MENNSEIKIKNNGFLIFFILIFNIKIIFFNASSFLKTESNCEVFAYRLLIRQNSTDKNLNLLFNLSSRFINIKKIMIVNHMA